MSASKKRVLNRKRSSLSKRNDETRLIESYAVPKIFTRLGLKLAPASPTMLVLDNLHWPARWPQWVSIISAIIF